MKLILTEHPAIGGATWSCLALEKNMRPEVWVHMGHRVVEVDDKQGKELMDAMNVSMSLQLSLRELYYRESATDLKPE